MKDPTKKPASKLGWIGLGVFALLCTAAVAARRKATETETVLAAAAPSSAPVATATHAQEPVTLTLTDNEKQVLQSLLANLFMGVAEGSDELAPWVARLVGEPVVTTADALQRAYDANEVSADLVYRKKRILVRGTVDSINRSLGESHYLTLRGGANMFSKPNARMVDGHVSYLAELSKGQKVILSCKGAGMLVGSAWLEECFPVATWLEAAVETTVRNLPAMVASREPNVTQLTVSALAIAAIVPADSQCWSKDGCTRELEGYRAKAVSAPGLSGQIATRTGLPEAEVLDILKPAK